MQYCEAINKSGDKCKNRAKPSEKYCGIHLKKLNSENKTFLHLQALLSGKKEDVDKYISSLSEQELEQEAEEAIEEALDSLTYTNPKDESSEPLFERDKKSKRISNGFLCLGIAVGYPIIIFIGTVSGKLWVVDLLESSLSFLIDIPLCIIAWFGAASFSKVGGGWTILGVITALVAILYTISAFSALSWLFSH